MRYIDFDRLRQFTATEFQNARPYPWINPHGALTDEGFEYRPDLALAPARRSSPSFEELNRQIDAQTLGNG